jgi:alpha-amylase/alpha-mannosidase (GH57 family)
VSPRPRYVCVHGHFYQPPRENPWLEAVERQDSAQPYHDWNERITVECYEPNAAARILDGEGRIRDLIDNYARMSFNFGPTLLTWMRRERPEAYRALLRSDRRSAQRFGGHGSALAQAYNHMILPLATRRDKRTQVRWGIEDFRFHFGREPEGMWLPETAVDTETLEVLAEEGIRFTILAPRQAAAVRPPDGDWAHVDAPSLETGRAYTVPLPSGAEIAVFFYDGATSRAIAFERLLNDGALLTHRLLEPLDRSTSEAPLSHVATDGETYGHHHRHGEMALAFALRAVEERPDVELVNYGLYLERHPPTWEARIADDTSWSCAHGVERWRSDCGCAIDPGSGSQAWRAPLRDALDGLRDALEAPYGSAARDYFDDPWEARDRYVDVLVDRSGESIDAFLAATARRPLEGGDRVRALRLLELQRHLLLMYTSCGWFFDDVGGIETIQILLYAGRVAHLAGELFGAETEDRIEADLLARLEEASSRDPRWRDAAEIYRRSVAHARVDLRKAAAHYAVSSVFEELEEHEEIYCYTYRREDLRVHRAGRASLTLGRVHVTSHITHNSERLTFAVLRLGSQDVAGGVRAFLDEDTYESLLAILEAPFRRTDHTTVIRVLDREFQASLYSLRSLFHDAQLRIVDTLLESSVEAAETTLGELYEERGPLLRLLADLGVPAPRPFALAAEYVLNLRLARILAQERPRLSAIRAVLEAFLSAAVVVDTERAAFQAEGTLERLVMSAEGSAEDAATLALVRDVVAELDGAGIQLDLTRVQNAFWRHLQVAGPLPPSGDGDPVESPEGPDAAAPPTAAEWRRELEALAATLRVALPEP